jgi:uncharacterized protein YgiM (DUF1202 family)
MRLFFTFLFFIFFLFTSNAQKRYCVNATLLNLRNAPTLSGSTVIAQFNKGTEVIVIDTNDGWSKVTIGNYKGYMRQDYLVDCTYSNNATPNHSTNDYNSDNVIICHSPKAYSYHKYNCRALSRCTYGTSNTSLQDAERSGRTPCRNCYR